MSDADKGIRSEPFALSMSQSADLFVLSRCARHISENAKEYAKGTQPSMNEDHKRMVVQLAKSLTPDMYQKRLRELSAINPKWVEYLDPIKEQFVAYCFLDKGIRRWGKVTSNGVETINGVFGDARSLPLVYLLEHVIQYQRKKYHDHYVLACKWSEEGRLITEYLRELQLQVSGKASRRRVDLIESNPPVYRARVQASEESSLTGYIEVKINLDTKVSECPCQFFEEMGVNCVHTKALLLHLKKSSAWCSTRYHISTYKQCYSASVPAMALAGKLSVDETFIPPEYKKPAGRPSNKRKEREWLRKTSIQRVCSSCGTPGHMYSTCNAPSTEYRYEKFKVKAMEWCRKQEITLVPE
jgi:hypothetical protein